MNGPPDDPDPILSGLEDEDHIDIECQITSCSRPGTVPRAIGGNLRRDSTEKHYVCTYHHRILLTIKIAIVVIAVSLLVIALLG